MKSSYECVSKIATYALVIIKKQKIKNIISERIFINLDNSTECEIFAIYQAIIIIKEKLYKNKSGVRFILKTDCTTVKDFFCMLLLFKFISNNSMANRQFFKKQKLYRKEDREIELNFFN